MKTVTRRWPLLFVTGYLALASLACGFHLRGSGSAALPESLSRLRVIVQDSKLANDPLLINMKNTLQVSPKVTVTDSADVPTLVLFGERTESQVLSVGSTGKASGYMLRYEVNYRLSDPKGKELLAPQTVRVVRDYTFDPNNLLAKEQEEQELRRAMQRDAVQQILRRLSRYTPAQE